MVTRTLPDASDDDNSPSRAQRRRSFAEDSPLSVKHSRLLFLYVLSITVLAFYGRAMPGPFLPLVLQDELGAPSSVVGYVTAAYPLAALTVTMWTTRFVRNNEFVVRTHSIAFIAMSVTIGMMSISVRIFHIVGYQLGIICMILFRVAQGVSFSMYIAANTALVTRFFPKDAPYVIALIEVAVGIGGQFGRVVGGFLYDKYGFGFPFLSIAIVQALWALVGFAFPANPPSQSQEGHSGTKKMQSRKTVEIPWKELLTPGTCVGICAVLLCYFQNGFYDATLAPFLKSHLHLTTVSVISLIMAMRSFVYLTTSYVCAEMMHRHVVSFDSIIIAGSFFCVLGFFLIAPASFLTEILALSNIDLEETTPKWIVLIIAVIVFSMGSAMIFVPSLPLMQSEVQSHGQKAVEQISSLFMASMSIGEASGPILGGWLVQLFGFATATSMVTGPYIFETLAAVFAARRAEADSLGDPLLSIDESKGMTRQQSLMPGTEEVALYWSVLQKRIDLDPDRPGSAPSIVFRRAYKQLISPGGRRQTPGTAPSSSFRREYAPRTSGKVR